jgi:hypothetical protein
MSKFLLNLLLQISKALIYSKIKFFIQKRIFPSLSAQSAQRRAGPSGLSPQPPPTFPLSHVSPPASQPSGLWPAYPAFPCPPSLTCGPRLVIFFPRPTAAAAVHGWSTVDHGWTWSTGHGPSPPIIQYKIIR